VLFWHVGATVAFIRYAFRDPNMDLRFLAVGAVVPDLIDLPIGIVMWGTYAAPRLGAHSLLFGALIMVAVLVGTRRGPRRKQWMLLAVGVLMHALLDALWRQPETLWWPFLGTTFASSGFDTYGAYVRHLMTNPTMWVGEFVGLAYLVWLGRRAGLANPEARSRLLSTGVVSGPVE
jgi:membrane-bound metal-dependent hydrolase YbcI (DUF457 family)